MMLLEILFDSKSFLLLFIFKHTVSIFISAECCKCFIIIQKHLQRRRQNGNSAFEITVEGQVAKNAGEKIGGK